MVWKNDEIIYECAVEFDVFIHIYVHALYEKERKLMSFMFFNSRVWGPNQFISLIPAFHQLRGPNQNMDAVTE